MAIDLVLLEIGWNHWNRRILVAVIAQAESLSSLMRGLHVKFFEAPADDGRQFDRVTIRIFDGVMVVPAFIGRPRAGSCRRVP